MGKHAGFNRVVGPLRYAARCAAEALALRLPNAPLPPPLPSLPLTEREVAWFQAILAAADDALPAEMDDTRETLRTAAATLAELLTEAQAHPLVRRERAALRAALPALATAAHDPATALADAVTAGTMTASQAAHWRYRLGIRDR